MNYSVATDGKSYISFRAYHSHCTLNHDDLMHCVDFGYTLETFERRIESWLGDIFPEEHDDYDWSFNPKDFHNACAKLFPILYKEFNDKHTDAEREEYARKVRAKKYTHYSVLNPMLNDLYDKQNIRCFCELSRYSSDETIRKSNAYSLAKKDIDAWILENVDNLDNVSMDKAKELISTALNEFFVKEKKEYDVQKWREENKFLWY